MPEPDPSPGAGVFARIVSEIRERGPMSFARFMELALYDPVDGYYTAGSPRLGSGGDYVTASDAGTAFGECLARQIEEMDRLLAEPETFALIEFGAGRGLLVRDLLDAAGAVAPALAARLRPVLVDASPAMRSEAVARVPEATVSAPQDIGIAPAGCALAVELFDALPVHRVRRTGGRLREIYVDLGPGNVLVEREDEPLAVTSEWAARYGAAPREGDEAEVCPAAWRQIDLMEECLERGFVVVVDYGYPAVELYGAAHRRGTLLAYHRHQTSEDYLSRVGEQDLTAHVNFTALEDRARQRGLSVLALTTQDRFLIANGILERFDETDPARWSDPRRVRRRLQAMQLIHPETMGRRFRVLVLSKAFSPPPALAGLLDPFDEGVKS